MAPMPDGHALKRHGQAAQRDLITSRKLQADRHPSPAEAPRQSHGRMARQIEWCRMALQLQDQSRLRAERADFAEGKRRERLRRNEWAWRVPRRYAKRPRRSMRRNRIAW